MKLITGFVAALIIALVIAGGCNKDSNPSGPSNGGSSLTPAEQQRIIHARDSISATADSLLTTSDPAQGFFQMLSYYRGLAGVDTAWVTDHGLFVRFTKGGIVSWNIRSSVVIPPYDGSTAAHLFKTHRRSTTSALVGNTNALLINQQYTDESRQYCRDLIDHLSALFDSNGYAVTIKDGSAANLNFMENHLGDYGAVFYISHGAYDGTHTWVCTGEEGTVAALCTVNLDEWAKDDISLGTVTETRNGQNKAVNYYMFSEKFINDSYREGDFPHSLIYLVACQGLKSQGMSDAFTSKGVSAAVGWDETNCLGQSTGRLLFDALLGGDSLGEAYASLPAEAKDDHCEVATGAHLVYYPASGASVRLVEPTGATLSLDSPVNGETYTDRIVTLSGYLMDASSITSGTVELNGVTTVLVASGTSFSQPLEIMGGLNTLRISCNGVLTSGRTARVDSSLSFTGNFAAQDLWTELRWNTDASDVDFHLLPPGSSLSDLWTSNDCYYANRTPSWGGQLDVDDVDGYGPEHITMTSATEPGTYRLFVHYYASHGAPTTDASVTVSALGGAKQDFGPYELNSDGGNDRGDLWEVCTITFPSGQITPVNQYYFLGAASGKMAMQKKY